MTSTIPMRIWNEEELISQVMTVLQNDIYLQSILPNFQVYVILQRNPLLGYTKLVLEITFDLKIEKLRLNLNIYVNWNV